MHPTWQWLLSRWFQDGFRTKIPSRRYDFWCPVLFSKHCFGQYCMEIILMLAFTTSVLAEEQLLMKSCKSCMTSSVLVYISLCRTLCLGKLLMCLFTVHHPMLWGGQAAMLLLMLLLLFKGFTTSYGTQAVDVFHECPI